MGLLDALFPPYAPLFTENKKVEDAEYGKRERALYKYYIKLLYRYGKWLQGIETDGAQYVAKSPFQRNGITCDNCVFYQPAEKGERPGTFGKGSGECYIVEGDIAARGFCKLWIIPDEVMK